MKGVALEKLSVLGKSPIELDYKNRKKIHQYMPVPNNYIIYWGDMTFGNNPQGLVITDNGVITRYKKVEKDINRKRKSKDIKKEQFRILRWDHIEIEKFEFKEDNEKLKIFYHDSILIELENNNIIIEYFNQIKDEIERYNPKDTEKIGSVDDINVQSYEDVVDIEGEEYISNEQLKVIEERQNSTIEIQTCYFESAEKFIKQCFNEENVFLPYSSKQSERQIKIEVPKDIYLEAVNFMSEKIKEGLVPGIMDPSEATKIVRKGKLTYKQAKNIAKSGIFEAITYDEETGRINCYFPLGMSFLVAWNSAGIMGKEKEEALKYALATGVEVFGISFVDSVIDSPISTSSITEIVKEVGDYIIEKIGHKATHTVVHSVREVAKNQSMLGGTVGKHLSKVLRLNAIVQALTFVVFSAPNTYRVLNRKISGSQYIKNLATLVGGMAAAGVGVLGASVATTEIATDLGTAIEPMATTVGFVAGAVAGITGSDAVKIVGDLIVEDDKVRLTRMYNEIINHMIIDYMILEKEIHILIDELSKINSKDLDKMFKELLASSNQEQYIIDYFNNYFLNIIKARPILEAPKEEEIVNVLNTNYLC